VAEALDLSEDAVMQRLSRGRKMLQERMLVFVETALGRSGPGSSFTLSVQAALPMLDQIGNDTRFVDIARQRARTLAERIRHQG